MATAALQVGAVGQRVKARVGDPEHAVELPAGEIVADGAHDELIGGVAGEGPAAHRDALGGDRHADHHLRCVGTLVLGVTGEASGGRFCGPPAVLRRRPRLGLVERPAELDLRISQVDLEVGRAGIEKDHVAGQIEEVGGGGEDRLGDLRQGRKKEVHRRVGGIGIEGRAALDGHALGDPAGGRQLGGRLQGALRDQGEADALNELSVEAPALRRRAQRLADAEAREQRIEHEGAATAAGIDDLDLGARAGGDGLGGIEEARDRGHQPAQRLAVHLVGTAEVVDDACHRAAGLGVALVVGQLQVADHRTVLVAPPCLSQVHAYKISRRPCSSQVIVCLQLTAFWSPSKRSEQAKRLWRRLRMPTNSGSPV